MKYLSNFSNFVENEDHEKFVSYFTNRNDYVHRLLYYLTDFKKQYSSLLLRNQIIYNFEAAFVDSCYHSKERKREIFSPIVSIDYSRSETNRPSY